LSHISADSPPEIRGASAKNHVVAFSVGATAEEINCREEQNLEDEADDEQLLVGGGLKAADVDVKIQLADVIKNPSCGDITDVHHHVDDGK
jgi:hypothetical protein